MALKVCENCGKEISDSAKSCVHCGAPVIKYYICKDCGTKMLPNVQICPNCGKKKSNTKKLLLILLPIIAFILTALIITIIVISSLSGPNKEYEEAMNKDDYEAAYKHYKTEDELEEIKKLAYKAGDYDFLYDIAEGSKEKEKILTENLIATLCYDLQDSLKNPSSFKLHHVYRNENKTTIILEYEGTNSYGGVVSGYAYYGFDKDDNVYEFYTSFNDFDEETVYSWDSYSDRLEKTLKNMCKLIAKSIIKDSSNKIDGNMVDRINDFASKNKLKDIKLLDSVKEIYPEKSDSTGSDRT